MWARVRFLLAVFVVLGALYACDDDVGAGATSTTSQPAELVVTVTFDGLEVSPTSIPSGEVTVRVEGDTNGSSELGGFYSPAPDAQVGGAPPVALVAAALLVEPQDA